MTAFADVRSNSLIVRARPRDLEEAAALIRKIDRDASGAMNQLKVIQEKNDENREILLKTAEEQLCVLRAENEKLKVKINKQR